MGEALSEMGCVCSRRALRHHALSSSETASLKSQSLETLVLGQTQDQVSFFCAKFHLHFKLFVLMRLRHAVIFYVIQGG